MTAKAKTIFEEAVQLNPVDKAELIERLYLSFSSSINNEIEEKWRAEVENRITAYDESKISSDTIENVFKRIANK